MAAPKMKLEQPPGSARLFSMSVLAPDQEFCLVISAERNHQDGGQAIVNWAKQNPGFINRSLIQWGAIVFRGFDASLEQFKLLGECVSSGAVATNYKGGIVPRKKVDDSVFLATESPKVNLLVQHHEMAYLPVSPKHVLFLCEVPPTSGGETPMVSTRRFMQRIDKKILRKFKEKGVLYRRYLTKEELVPNYIIGWKRAYETEDKKKVEEFCKDNNIDFEWTDNDALITRNLGTAVRNHPVTNEELWHNVAFNWHRNSGVVGELTPAFVRTQSASWSKELHEFFKTCHPDKFYVNSYYGDGELIEASVIDHIDKIMVEEERSFSWGKGDMMVLDNMLTSHGRNPYEGDQRRVLSILKFD